MNIRKIIREEMDNSLGWINDIKPALNQEQNWILVNDVNPNDIKEGIKIQKYLFNLGYEWFSSEIIMDTIYGIHHFPSKGLRGNLTYYNNKENERELADREIERNNNVYYWSQIKPNEINESDDLDWIRDVNTQLPKNSNWWLINDIDPHSLEVSEEIQQFLFDQGFEWVSGRREFLPEIFYAVSQYVGSDKTNYGRFGFYKSAPNIEKEIERERSIEGGEIYYWSQLKPDSLNESQEDPLQWMKDIEAGDLWTPYVGMKFIVTDGSDDVIYHILNINDEEGWMELKWKDNRSGEEEYFGYYIEDYYRMVGEDRVKIVH